MFFDAKRAVFAVMALVIFGIFLGHFGRLDPVVEVAEVILPEPAPAPEIIVDQPEVEIPDFLGGDPAPAEPTPTSPLGVLDSIPAFPSPTQDYDRDLFGPSWADVDRNGCDTRNDVLARDLADETFREGTNNCVVITGTFTDPYTAQNVVFAKEDAGAVPIDHVVALSWAWQNGAYSWDEATRLRFANDPLNLQATTRSENSRKSDHGPAGWMPPNSAYRCDYVARFIVIVDTYELGMGESDRATLRRELASC